MKHLVTQRARSTFAPWRAYDPRALRTRSGQESEKKAACRMFKQADDFPIPGFCRICHRPIPNRAHSFCDEHYQQYERRQREGVTTDDLSAKWEDTLATWRERPAALDGELGPRAHATPLVFALRPEDWLLFLRSYDLFMTRAADCLAVNVQTGATRRFVDVTTEDVLDDLHGGRPAAYQAELAPFWGEAGPTGLRLADRVGQRPNLSVLVAAAPFPVYGLAGQPCELTLCSVSWDAQAYRPTHIGFVFSSPRYPAIRENFSLSSADPKQRGLAPSKNTAQAFQLDPSTQLFENAGTIDRAQGHVGTVTLRQGYGTLEGRQFLGQIRHWAQPPRGALVQRTQGEGVFYLESEETILRGGSLGPPEAELLQLLTGLVVLNQRPDVLAQYQQELAQEEQRLFGG